MRSSSSRVASKDVDQLSLQSRTLACLAKNRRSHIDAQCKVCRKSDLDTIHSAVASLLSFHSQGTFHSVLVKNASHHVSAYGHLAFRPRLLSRAPAYFYFRCTFFHKMTNIRFPYSSCSRVREMRIRVLDEGSWIKVLPVCPRQGSAISQESLQATTPDPELLRYTRLREGFAKSVVV
jgi:hypothetical protein